MVGKRRSETHLMPCLYVKRGRRKDTYWTKIAGKYHGLGNDRVAAERRLRDLIEGKPTAGTLAELAERFIEAITEEAERGDEGALNTRTIADYTEALRDRLMPAFGRMAVHEFKPTHAAQYLELMKKKRRAVRANREIAALGSMFAYGTRHGIVSANPCHGVKRNVERSRMRRPTIAEVNKLIEIAKSKGNGSYMVALIGVMVAVTGRRRAEVMRLTVAAETPEGLAGAEAKGKRGAPTRPFLVAWTPFLRQLMAETKALERAADSIYLFPSRNGGPYSEQGFKAMWNRIMADFVAGGGERFTAHDLRALFVSEKLDRGEDPKTHKNPATTHGVYARGVVRVKPLA